MRASSSLPVGTPAPSGGDQSAAAAASESASHKELIKYSQLFEDEITLDNLTYAQLQAVCRLLDVTAIGIVAPILRFQLRLKLRQLEADDRVSGRGFIPGQRGPISALWEWDRDENHHQAQLDICTQFGPNPPGSLGAGSRQTDRQTDIVFYI